MNNFLAITSIGFLIVLASTAAHVRSAHAQAAFSCSSERVCQFDETRLPVRVVVRPSSALYSEADEGSEQVYSNLPAFRPWYVMDSTGVDYSDPDNPAGFFHVAPTRDSAARGWLAARDAIVWKTNIVVTYAPRGAVEEDKRARVLMFNTLDGVKTLMEGGDAEGLSADIFGALEARDLAALEGHGVVLAEPQRELDYAKGAYFLPVIDHQTYAYGLDQTALYLQVAAAVPQTEEDTGRGEGTLTSQSVLETVEAEDTASLGQLNTQDFKIDIVFAIDMTGSMQPYLDATAQAVSTIVGQIEEQGLEDAVNYGLVGYTDISSQCGGCYFDVARNFTPDLTDSAAIRAILGEKKWARDGGDWQETVLAGVRQAILNTNWSENSSRFIFLIGDAVSRETDSDGKPLTPDAVVSLARNAAQGGGVQIFAIHPRPAEVSSSTNRAAEEQFRIVSRNPLGQGSYYFGFDIDQANPADVKAKFQTALQDAIGAWLPAISAVRGGDVARVEELFVEAEKAAVAVEEGTADASEMALAALAPQLTEYLGSAAERPRDVVAWAVNVDPTAPEKVAVEARVLLEKRDLSDLVATMEEIHRAYLAAEITGGTLFEELRAGSASGVLDTGTDARATDRLAKSGLAPRWIASLPYKSRLLTLTEESFAAMDPSAREDFETELEVKLEILKDYVNSPDIWQAMSPDVSELDRVFPVPLADLP